VTDLGTDELKTQANVHLTDKPEQGNIKGTLLESAHLLLHLAHGPPPGASLFGNPSDLVGTLRGRIGINLTHTTHLSQEFQEAIDWTTLGG
jgi:hypothetical protein